jgi:hypothetical protein
VRVNNCNRPIRDGMARHPALITANGHELLGFDACRSDNLAELLDAVFL